MMTFLQKMARRKVALSLGAMMAVMFVLNVPVAHAASSEIEQAMAAQKRLAEMKSKSSSASDLDLDLDADENSGPMMFKIKKNGDIEPVSEASPLEDVREVLPVRAVALPENMPAGDLGSERISYRNIPSVPIVSSDRSVEIFSLSDPVSAPQPQEEAVRMQGRSFPGQQDTLQLLDPSGEPSRMLSKSEMAQAADQGADNGFVSVAGDALQMDGGAILYFKHGSSQLTPEGLAMVKKLARSFDPANGRGLSVEGHASTQVNVKQDSAQMGPNRPVKTLDEKQRKIANLKVSMNRAFAVSKVLIENGVPAEAIRVTGWGETHPPENAPEGKTLEAASRRVEVFE